MAGPWEDFTPSQAGQSAGDGPWSDFAAPARPALGDVPGNAGVLPWQKVEASPEVPLAIATRYTPAGLLPSLAKGLTMGGHALADAFGDAPILSLPGNQAVEDYRDRQRIAGSISDELTGRKQETPLEAGERVGNAFTFEPSTPAAKAVAAPMDWVAENLSKAGKFAGETIQSIPDTPVLPPWLHGDVAAAMADTATQVAPLILGEKAVRGGVDSIKAARTATSAARTGFGNLGADFSGDLGGFERPAPPDLSLQPDPTHHAPNAADSLKAMADSIKPQLEALEQAPPVEAPSTPPIAPVNRGTTPQPIATPEVPPKVVTKGAPDELVDSGTASPNLAQPRVAAEETPPPVAAEAPPTPAPAVEPPASVPVAGSVPDAAGAPRVEAPKPPESVSPLVGMDDLRRARDDGTATPEQLHALSRLQDTAAHTADVGGELLPGVLNARGRAQLEASGQLKPFRVKTDLDDFKEINDVFGHGVGDEALKLKAEAMREAFGDGNSWREGGDEFGAHADTEAEAHAKMAQVRESLKGTKLVGEDIRGNPVADREIGVSYGVGNDAKAADRALYADKTKRTATGERKGRRATDVAGVGAGSEGQGGGEVPRSAPGQETAVAEHAQGQRPAETVAGSDAASARTELAGARPDNLVDAAPLADAGRSEKAVPVADDQAAPGAVPKPAETQPGAAPSISVANKAVEADRLTRGVDAITSEQGTSRAESWNRAKETAKSDPDAGRRLTQAVIDGEKKTLTQDDVALLLHDRVRVSNEYHAAMDEAAKATGELDQAAALLRLKEAERQLDANDLADRKSGSESSWALSARQMLAKEDYSLARVGQRLKIAEGVESVTDLPVAVKERFQALVAENEKLTAQLEQHAKNSERGPRKTVDQKAQEKLAAQMAKLEQTIKERLAACPI